MAGIIGQLTAHARKRKESKKIHSDKCMYKLPTFDSNGFNPQLHNSYVRNCARFQVDENIVDGRHIVVQIKVGIHFSEKS